MDKINDKVKMVPLNSLSIKAEYHLLRVYNGKIETNHYNLIIELLASKQFETLSFYNVEDLNLDLVDNIKELYPEITVTIYNKP